jgi:DNA-binding IclR family transcriptional regulator
MGAEAMDGAEKRVSLVDRAARILACFSRGEPELSLPQISSRLSLPKPTAFRILGELARLGLIEHDRAANLYRLGFAALRLADSLLGGNAVRAKARPVMQVIRDAANETVILSLRDGDHRINIDSVDSRQAIAGTLQLGVRIPLYAGAASQVLLAGMDDDEIAAYLARTELAAFSSSTLTSPDAIGKRLTTIRKQGHAISTGEFTQASGASAIAVPVRDRSGATVAALHVSAPKSRLTPELQRLCLSALTTGSKALAAQLG